MYGMGMTRLELPHGIFTLLLQLFASHYKQITFLVKQ